MVTDLPGPVQIVIPHTNQTREVHYHVREATTYLEIALFDVAQCEGRIFSALAVDPRLSLLNTDYLETQKRGNSSIKCYINVRLHWTKSNAKANFFLIFVAAQCEH